jgi:hypothetical protein
LQQFCCIFIAEWLYYDRYNYTQKTQKITVCPAAGCASSLRL